MKKRCLLGVAMCALVSVSAWQLPEAAGVHAYSQAPSAAGLAAPSDLHAAVTKYCVGCHNERTRAGGLLFDRIDFANIPADAEIWEKVVRKLRGGLMPPPGSPRPDRDTSDRVITLLATALDGGAAVHPNPGRAVLRRLNRTEYANEIRELLALELDDIAAMLPADNSAYGFDNIGDVLEVSPALLERYLAAAERISAVAIGDPALPPGEATYTVRADLTQTTHVDGLPLGTRGGVIIRYVFPLDGEYVIQPRLFRTNQGLVRGLRETHQVEITVDGERVHLAPVGGPADYLAILENRTIVGDALDTRLRARAPLKAGPRDVAVSFVYKTAAHAPELLQPLLPFLNPIEMNGMPQIRDVSIRGPFNATGPGDTPSRRKILSCRPTRADREASCAREILKRLASRAYRRPVSEADLGPLLTFYAAGRRTGDFERGIQLALQRILASPLFVFRVERDPPNVPSGAVYPVGDVELASRLSFFLWSSGPDPTLLALAGQGKLLQDPGVLSAQVRRMLGDPRAQALVTNFAAQWLYLRNLRGVSPNALEFFPEFDDNLRQAFQRETELFFESIMREDRSVLELLTADYTFVNERLARHYRIPGVYGGHFRRVTLADEARRGLLGKGSILTVTSYPHRTSPVIRGKWILENLLATPPAPPPPNVPDLPDNEEGKPATTLRGRLEAHRANPTCASCHRVMDPLGLALENFDAIGAWRTQEGGAPIDASGQLSDGTAVNGVVTLREALVRRPETFVNALAEKLLTYALGRGLGYSDMPAVRRIVREAAREDYRFSSLVLAIVKSVPFRVRVKADEGAALSATRR